MKPLVFFLFTAFSTLIFAAEPLFEISDPKNDDFGAGNIVYPASSLWEKGELDLVSFSAETDKDGTWFKLTFNKPIKSPKHQIGLFGNEDMTQFVKYDFFNLNADIYFDMDSIPGKGATWTLPGRNTTIHPQSAWEKAVVLCPRPLAMASQLENQLIKRKKNQAKFESGSMGKEDFDALQNEIQQETMQNLFFPTKIRVTKRAISFFVPDTFFNGPVQLSWKASVLVTGADPMQNLSMKMPGKSEAPLMMVPVEDGKPKDTFGSGDLERLSHSAVIDLLWPEEKIQEKILGHYPVQISGIPLGNGIVPVIPDPLLEPAHLLEADKILENVEAPEPVQPQTATHPVAPQKPSAPIETPSPAKSIETRLREVQRLFDQKLITEKEYKELREKILSEL